MSAATLDDHVTPRVRSRVGGALLLLGGLVALGSCALPWISAVTENLVTGVTRANFTWYAWSIPAIVGLPFILAPSLALVPLAIRDLLGMRPSLRRVWRILPAVGGLMGTLIYLLLFIVAAMIATFGGFKPAKIVTLSFGPGPVVCAAGFVLALGGALLTPGPPRMRSWPTYLG